MNIEEVQVVCAWCGLYRVGDQSSGHWVAKNPSPDSVPISHGICEKCFAIQRVELRSTRQKLKACPHPTQ